MIKSQTLANNDLQTQNELLMALLSNKVDEVNNQGNLQYALLTEIKKKTEQYENMKMEMKKMLEE